MLYFIITFGVLTGTMLAGALAFMLMCTPSVYDWIMKKYMKNVRRYIEKEIDLKLNDTESKENTGA